MADMHSADKELNSNPNQPEWHSWGIKDHDGKKDERTPDSLQISVDGKLYARKFDAPDGSVQTLVSEDKGKSYQKVDDTKIEEPLKDKLKGV